MTYPSFLMLLRRMAWTTATNAPITYSGLQSEDRRSGRPAISHVGQNSPRGQEAKENRAMALMCE
jgi:hypothetical protein